MIVDSLMDNVLEFILFIFVFLRFEIKRLKNVFGLF